LKIKALYILILLNILCSASGQTGFVCPEDCLKHDTGKKHPEKKERLDAILKQLKEKGLFSKLVIIEAAPEPLDKIRAVHPPEYIKEVEESCFEEKSYLHSKDTIISKDSYLAACMAAAGVTAAVDAVMNRKVKNAFCAVRPPGHHASKNKAMGFCIFNNVAIGARYVQNAYKLRKVLIVDFDVHHGNGTQDIFKNDPNVLYFSIHRSPFYPGTGNAEEKGCGNIVNVPLPKSSGDAEYVKVFEETFRSRAFEFKPDFIFISAGFDAHKDDPLGGMNLTAECYGKMTAIIKEIAEKHNGGRIVSVLEGGYGPGLADSVYAHITELMK